VGGIVRTLVKNRKRFASMPLFVLILVGVIITSKSVQAETFGKTDIGGTDHSVLSPFYMYLTNFTNPYDNFNITQLSVYTRSAESGKFMNITMVLYDDDGEPNILLINETDVGWINITSTPGWVNFTVPGGYIAPAGIYWIGAYCQGGDTAWKMYYDNPAGNVRTVNDYDFVPLNNPFLTPESTYSNVYSMYASNETVNPYESGDLNYYDLDVNSTVAGQGIEFSAKWLDSNGMQSYIFGWNNSGTFLNDSAVDWTPVASPAWNTIEKTLNSTEGYRIEAQIWANDTLNNWGTTGKFIFETTDATTFSTILSEESELANCEFIQNAVDRASNPSTVLIPSGTWNFSESVATWDTVEIPVGVDVAGGATERDEDDQVIAWKTVLVMPFEAPQDSVWFKYTISNNISFRFTEIKMIGYRFFNTSSETMYTAIKIFAPYASYPTDGILDFRIDHCNFQDIAGSAITFGDESEYNRRVVRGLIDHNVLNNTYGDPGFMDYENRTLGYGFGIRRWASDTWEPDITKVIGKYTNYTIVIEDNYFTKWRHCVSTIDGVHQVFRYNVVEGGYGIGETDGHGSYADGSHPYAVGTRALEVYGNTFKNPDTTWNANPFAINHRGGGGIMYNNTIIGYEVGTGGLIDLNNDWGNYEPYCPQCFINNTYIWNNTLNGADLIHYNSDNVEDVNYFLRAPNIEEEGWEFIPYEYPHPLSSGNSPPNAPSLDSPVNETRTDMGMLLTFNWTFSDPDVEDTQIGYQIQIDNNASFGSPEVNHYNLSTSNNYTDQNLPNSVGGFYWRVKTWDNVSAEGSWSSSRYIIGDRQNITVLGTNDSSPYVGYASEIYCMVKSEYDDHELVEGDTLILEFSNGTAIPMAYNGTYWTATLVSYTPTTVFVDNYDTLYEQTYGISKLKTDFSLEIEWIAEQGDPGDPVEEDKVGDWFEVAFYPIAEMMGLALVIMGAALVFGAMNNTFEMSVVIDILKVAIIMAIGIWITLHL